MRWAVPENADLLEITAASERIALEPESTLLEVALAIWMAVPEALKWMHRRQSTTRLRSFVYFSSEDGVSGDFSLNEERIRQLEHSLALYFEKRDRGYGCQIHHYPQEHEHWFLISHGERYKRKTTWEKGKLGRDCSYTLTIAIIGCWLTCVSYAALALEVELMLIMLA